MPFQRAATPVLSLLVLLLFLPGCYTQQDHKRMARAFLSAETAEETLAPAAREFELWIGEKSGPAITRDEFYEMIQWDSALNRVVRILQLQSRGVTAVAEIHETNDFARLLGHPGWDARMTFWFEDNNHGGRIAEALYEPDPGNESWQPYLDEALPWIREHHAETLARFFPGDELVQTAESARAWRRILIEWRAATDREPIALAGRAAR